MRKHFLSLFVSFLSLIILISTASAQKKQLTYGQVFNQEQPKLFAKLPNLKGWIDDSHYLEARKNSKTKLTQLIKIEAESGEESIFLDYVTFVSNFPEDLNPEDFVTHTPDYSSFLYQLFH